MAKEQADLKRLGNERLLTMLGINDYALAFIARTFSLTEDPRVSAVGPHSEYHSSLKNQYSVGLVEKMNALQIEEMLWEHGFDRNELTCIQSSPEGDGNFRIDFRDSKEKGRGRRVQLFFYQPETP